MAERRRYAGPMVRTFGIVNVTRDSFSDGGRFLRPEAALEHAERLYNLVATKYNLAIASPPGSLVASVAGFKRAELIPRA